MTSLARAATILGLIGGGTLALFNVGAATARKWKEVTPEDAKAVTIQTKKSAPQYYSLDGKRPLAVKVTGPGAFRVYSRAVLPDAKKEGIYGIVVLRDGEKRYLISRTAKHSTAKVVGSEKVRVGVPKSVTLKVPAGEHEFQVTTPHDAKRPVYVRFLLAERAKKKATGEKINYIAYLPRKFGEEVRIVVKEQEYIYYRATVSSPVELEVIGPTRIKGVSRLEFDHTMHGDKPYRVQASENSNVIQTSPFTGKISGTATYSKPTEKVIGQGDTFFINVPEGKHRYIVTTPDKGSSVLLRFYLPEKALGNELKPANKNGSAGLIRGVGKPSKG